MVEKFNLRKEMMKKTQSIFIGLVASLIFAACLFIVFFLYSSLRKLFRENLPPKIIFPLSWEEILIVSCIVAIAGTIATVIIMIINKDNTE